MKKESNKKINPTPLGKIKALVIISLILLILGEFSIFFIYKTNLTEKNELAFWKYPFVIQQNENFDTNYQDTFFFIASLSFAISVIINLFFLFRAKRFFSSLYESNQEVLENISSLKEGKNDEIKELAMTRDILLMKLMGIKNL